MWPLLISLGILGLEYTYHNWIAPTPPPPPPVPSRGVTVPTTTIGSPVPLLYGRVRVNSPVLVWTNVPVVVDGPTLGAVAPFVYEMDMAFVLGIGFSKSATRVGFEAATTRLLGMWAGQAALDYIDTGETGNGGFETPSEVVVPLAGGVTDTDSRILGPRLELLNGGPSQTLIDGSGNPQAYFGVKLAVRSLFGAAGPDYRNYITVLLFSDTAQTVAEIEPAQWIVGVSPQVSSYQFEVSSYPRTSLGSGQIGADCNPIDVLYDLMTGTFSKLGLDPARIDLVSFRAAAATLADEGNGFSRVWDQTAAASDMISEILTQIDGTMYEDPATGLMAVRLIRPDYDPNALQEINPSNCTRIENFALSGQLDIPNRVQINFTNRETGYQPDAAIAANQANVVNQRNEVRITSVNLPGVCTLANANAIASRTLIAASRPLAKCSAYVSRDFYRATIGEPLLLTWPAANISRAVMRVMAVNHGTMRTGEIKLDLIQDYFYQFKRQAPQAVPLIALG